MLFGLHTPLDPLHNDGYQFWSGIGFSTGWLIYYRRHNCHRRGCPLLCWKEHPDQDGHVVCRLHHPHHHGLLSRLFARLGWHHGDSKR